MQSKTNYILHTLYTNSKFGIDLLYNSTDLLPATKHNQMLLIKQPFRIRWLTNQELQGVSVGGRSAVLFRFVLRNFKLKIKAFTQEKFCKTER